MSLLSEETDYFYSYISNRRFLRALVILNKSYTEIITTN